MNMMLDKALEVIIKNPQFLSQHLAIVENLAFSGLLDYMRTAGMARLKLPYKDAVELSLNAARVQGWQDCLDTIITFKDQIYGPEIEDRPQNTPRSDFGSLDKAVERGDLTREEADAIRSDTKPDYSIYTSTDKLSTTGS
jgi:hypothetical protein